MEDEPSKKAGPSTKKPKLGIPRIEADKLRAEKDLRGAHRECPICKKDLSNFGDMRRGIHVNNCVDSDKNKEAVERAKMEVLTMFNCPSCNESISKGPYLLAHASKCAKAFDIPVADMIKSLEIAATVVKKRRELGLQKAAPVTTEMVEKAKKRIIEEESILSSENEQSKSTISKLLPPKSKVPKSVFRSTVFNSREPVNCRCNGLHIIQKRFCDQFKVRRNLTIPETSDGIEKTLLDKKFKTLTRLTRLADDLRRSLLSQKTDVRLKTQSGKFVNVHSFILKIRTKLEISTSLEVNLDEFSFEAVESWVNYVYTTATDWTLNEQPEIRQLADLYGPTDLCLYFLNDEDDDLYGGHRSFEKIDLNQAIQESEFSSVDAFKKNDEILKSFLDDFVLPVEKEAEVKTSEVIPNVFNETTTAKKSPKKSDVIFLEDSVVETPKKQVTPTNAKNDYDLFDSSSSRKDEFQRSPSIEVLAFTVKTSAAVEVQNNELNGSFELFETPPSSPIRSPSHELPKRSIGMHSPGFSSSQKRPHSPPFCDSFMEDFSFKQPSTSEIRTPIDKMIPKEMTETGKKRRIETRLGSGVKVLKLTNITPMPDYASYTKQQLVAALAEYGLRDMAPKKAVEKLKKLYEEQHPIVDLNVQTPKRLGVPMRLNFDDETNSSENHSQSQESIMNESMEDVLEESCLFDDDSPTKMPNTKLIKDVEQGQKIMLEWLRLPENKQLYCTVLSMQPVTWNELVNLMSSSNHDVKKITKKILAEVLDKLHITFTLPDVKWKKGKGYKNG